MQFLKNLTWLLNVRSNKPANRHPTGVFRPPVCQLSGRFTEDQVGKHHSVVDRRLDKLNDSRCERGDSSCNERPIKTSPNQLIATAPLCGMQNPMEQSPACQNS